MSCSPACSCWLPCYASSMVWQIASGAASPANHQAAARRVKRKGRSRSPAPSRRARCARSSGHDRRREGDHPRTEGSAAEERAIPDSQYRFRGVLRYLSRTAHTWLFHRRLLRALLVLNLALLASGIGLLASRSWGRKTGVWVSVLKIVRLVAVYGFAISVVAPVFAQRMSQALGKMLGADAATARARLPGAG